ncbi:unnamed protein product, partial [Symbiodinium necroappetens]
MADYMLACSASKEEDREVHMMSPVSSIKALRWVAKTLQWQALSEAILSPVISAYGRQSREYDRKEATPIPMALLACWERNICSAEAPVPGRRPALHACKPSLRRCTKNRMDYTATKCALHGTAYATKTTKCGQPFACTWHGITGRCIQSSWLLQWLSCLVEVGTEADLEPDFLFFHADLDSRKHPQVFPCSYAHALLCLRFMAQKAGLAASEAFALTLHSMKSTMLAAAAQIQFDEHARLAQGHHRDSLRLYSRNDTLEALRLQIEHAIGSRMETATQYGQRRRSPRTWAIFTSRHESLRSNTEPQSHEPDEQQSTRPDTDSEAELVEKYARERTHSSEEESEEPTAPAADEELFVCSGPWNALHSPTRSSHLEYELLYGSNPLHADVLIAACGADLGSMPVVIKTHDTVSACSDDYTGRPAGEEELQLVYCMATQSGAEGPGDAPHSAHDELNNEEGLQRILRELCVPPAMHQALRAQGICCIADFAYAYNSAADLDNFATSKDEEFWTALQVTEQPLHSMPMARLRRALVQAQIRVKAYEAERHRAEEPAPQSSAPSSSTAPPTDSWVEHAPTAQLISTALFDDTPTLSIAEVNINESSVSNARKFGSPGHGLRNVSTEEMLDADRKLWRSIATLVEEQGFSLDEALREMTHVRGDIATLMQARPRMPAMPPAPHAPYTPPGPPKGPRKGAGKTGKADSPNRPQRTIDKHQAQQLERAMQNLQITHGKKTLCLRYNKTQCNNANCKYEHRCAIKMPNGQACGGQHPAHKHRFKQPRSGTDTDGASSAVRGSLSSAGASPQHHREAQQSTSTSTPNAPQQLGPEHRSRSPEPSRTRAEEKKPSGPSATASAGIRNRFFFACIDSDNHEYSQAVVDRHLHCLSPPATHSQMDILKDPAEAHKLLQLAYSGLVGLLWCDALEEIQDEDIQQHLLDITKAVLETAGHFFVTLPAHLPDSWRALLQESNAHCWQLPGPRGIRHAVSSLQEISQMQGTKISPQAAADLAALVVSPGASASVPWQDFGQHCSGPFKHRRPAVCDGAGLNSAADKSVPQGNTKLQTLSEQWIQYLPSENLLLHLVEHIHEGRDAHPFTEEQQQRITSIAHEALHPGCQSKECTHISQGQPFRLALLRLFAEATGDPDTGLCAMLEEGVSTGIFEPIPSSMQWVQQQHPIDDADLDGMHLLHCQGNWTQAEKNPQLLD